MFRRSVCVPVILSVLVLVSIGAGTSKLVFLAPDAVNVTRLLPDPPTLNSEEWQDEVDLMLKLQSSRSDADKARIAQEDDFSVFVFADVLGPWFTEANCPKTAALFASVEGDSKVFANIGKKHWQRPRPYTSVAALNPAGKTEKSFSYPSSHSTRGSVCAEILASIFPDKRAALLERGRQIGWDRVIAGVHYPSDIAAGRVLGHALAEQFLASPAFNLELADVKAELQQASQPAVVH